MAGGGSIQSMNTIIKNNRNLLKKNRTFIKNKKDLFRESGGELEFKKLSKAELDIVKASIRKKAKQDTFKMNFILSVIILIMVTIFVYFGYEEYKKEVLYEKAIFEKEKRYRFNRMIGSANFSLGTVKLEKSLKRFKSAKKLYPNDSVVNSRIKLVDSLIRVDYQIKN